MGTKSADCPFDIDEDKLAEGIYNESLCKVGSGYGSRTDARDVAGIMIRSIEIHRIFGTIEAEKVQLQISEAGDRVINLEQEVERLSAILAEHKISKDV